MDKPAPPANPHPASSKTPRWALILPIILTAVIVGGTAGLLAHAGGSNVPSAILAGGGAFAGTVALLLAIVHFADAGRS